MQEIWREIADSNGLYLVSNHGRIARHSVRILTPQKSNKGYLYVDLSIAGKKTRVLVHRAVAEAFCSKPLGKNIVNHLDNNPTNNNADNLEWTTQQNNIQYAADQGRVKGNEHSGMQAREACRKPVVGWNEQEALYYESITDAAKDGFSRKSVWKCCAGMQKEHMGFSWRYATEQEKAEKERD